MSKLLPLLALVLFCAPAAFADDARAQEILKQARHAIGGEEQLQKVQGLQIHGQYRRVFGDRQMGGDREISISYAVFCLKKKKTSCKITHSAYNNVLPC